MVETSEKVSSSYARKDLEFFKVYLPEFGSHELVIPQAFINILDKPLPKKVVLVDEIGRLWDVETKTEERVGVVSFRQGWENFANGYSLGFGDFLLFRYDGDSRFNVTIFAKDGCKKDLDRVRVVVEKEPVVISSIKPEPWEDCGKRVMQNRKRVSVRDEPSVLGEIKPDRRRNTRRKINRSRDPREMSWVADKKQTEFEEPAYKPKNPHFVRNITAGSLRLLEIPTTFLKANGIELEEGQDIELCDENGEKWPLKINKKQDRGHIFSYDSWLCFCESHNLRNPNKCLFEFIVSSDGTCNQILVRIFRGMLLTTATKSGYHVLSM